MSQYTVRINGRTEFLIKCDTCRLCTTSLEHKDFMFKGIICPRCRKQIDMENQGELPESEFRADF